MTSRRTAAGYLVEWDGHFTVGQITNPSALSKRPWLPSTKGAWQLVPSRLLSPLPVGEFQDGRVLRVLCYVLLTLFFSPSLPSVFERRWRPVLGWSRAETGPVVPVRGCLEGIRRRMATATSAEAADNEASLWSVFGNPHKVSVHALAQAVRSVHGYSGTGG